MLCKPNTICCVQWILLLIQTLKQQITTVDILKECNMHVNIIFYTPVYVRKFILFFSLEDLPQENGTHFYFFQVCYVRALSVFQIIQSRILGRFVNNALESMWQKAVNTSFEITSCPSLHGVFGETYEKYLNQNNQSTIQGLKAIPPVFEATMLPT